MQVYRFKLVLAEIDKVVNDLTQEELLRMADSLFDAGCDDGSPGVSEGVVSVEFDREAANLREAVESAIGDVERAGYRVDHVDSIDRDVFVQINTELSQRATG